MQLIRRRFFSSILVVFLCGLPRAAVTPVSADEHAKEHFPRNSYAAGGFFPKEADALSAWVDGALRKGEGERPAGAEAVLIVPHAGYVYSGETAARTYALLKGQPIKTAVILFPSHRIPLRKASFPPPSIFSSPLGEIPVDEELRVALRSFPDVFEENAVPFAQEHALEVQLPFLQKVLPGVSLLPIAVGESTEEECRNIAGALNRAIGTRKNVVVVVSTDLYHGYDLDDLHRSDTRTVQCLAAGDPRELYAGLKDGSVQMCGGYAATVGLAFAQLRGYGKARIIHKTDSAEATGRQGGREWSVGYVGMLLTREDEGGHMLTEVQKKRLLAIARDSIDTFLRTGKKLSVKESDPELTAVCGAFVTLHAQGKLRGCIGNIVGQKPLYVTVRDMAVESATGDPRFPAVTYPELSGIEIEISALSPLRKVSGAEDIILGTHGVLIRKGAHSGVFLPQVAAETGWSKEEFLSYLCSHKAYLPADAWKDPSAELYVFTAEVFSEKEHGL